MGLLGLAGSGEGWNWCWVLWIISVFPPSAALGAEMVAVARGGWGEREVPPFNCKLEISSAPGSQLIEASSEAPDNTSISHYNSPGYYPTHHIVETETLGLAGYPCCPEGAEGVGPHLQCPGAAAAGVGS